MKELTAYDKYFKDRKVLVDDEDYEYLKDFNWHLDINGYAKFSVNKNGKHISILIHRMIFRLGSGDIRVIDHINGNPLDNRKENLRMCTQQENMFNKKSYGNKKYKGVYYHKRDGKYEANIRFNKKSVFIGRFDNPVDAAKAYNLEATRLFGEFAKLNEL